MHLFRKGRKKRNALIMKCAGIKSKPVDHTPWSESINIGIELLRVLTLPVFISIDSLALNPVYLFPASIVKDLIVRFSRSLKDIHLPGSELDN